jgi:hypothetical protein
MEAAVKSPKAIKISRYYKQVVAGAEVVGEH